jgi:hypothetical protein
MDRISLIGKDKAMQGNDVGKPKKLQIETIVHRTMDNDNAMSSSIIQ